MGLWLPLEHFKHNCVDVMWWLLIHGEVNGLFNLGTGEARTWNDLAYSLFAALNRPPLIEYIPMPDALRDKYQYLTQASTARPRRTGCPLKFHSLEESVLDYVVNHRQARQPFLRSASIDGREPK
jgi:ADP-L-glycero-D-manno-heptose 6-epimerase